MTGFVEKVLGGMTSANPEIPAEKIAGAIAETIAAPTVTNIIADIELAISLFEEIKAKLQGMPPSVINIIKAIF